MKAKLVEKGSPRIEQRAGVRGGAPVIAGTGIRVLDIAMRYEVMQMTPEEILIAFPHLTLAQIHAALSYYYAHKTRLDREWKASLRKTAKLRRAHPPLLEQKLGQIKTLHR